MAVDIRRDIIVALRGEYDPCMDRPVAPPHVPRDQDMNELFFRLRWYSK